MTQAVTCPGCQQQIAIDDSPQQNQLNQALTELEQQRKIPKMQPWVPNFRCESGNCNQLHENPLYSKRPKGKCNNCDQFSATKEGPCPWCQETDSIEEIDKDDLENLGIRLPD